MVAELWEQHHRLDTQFLDFKKAGDTFHADAYSVAADDTFRRIRTLEELGTQVRPVTLRDAVAALTLIHSAIYTSVLNEEPTTEKEVAALLQNAVWSLAIIARHCDYDLAGIHRDQLTDIERKIARGEVPA
ncbi:hypothetical protein MHZ93_06090 [Roseomonas sp. ACRSG]|nr:hypothetical protein [Roseomonas sp. ACRSG]